MVSARDLRSQLRISVWPVLLAMVVLAQVALYLGEQTADPGLRSQLQVIGLALLVSTVVAFGLDHWNTVVARWLLIAPQILLVGLAAAWAGIPGTLALLVVPAFLSAALLGVEAAVLVGIISTAIVLVASWWAAVPLSPSEPAIALAALWCGVAATFAVYHPILQLAAWMWDYYARARDQLEEARNRKAELAQALDDLAFANRQMALANERVATLRTIAEQAVAAKTAFVASVSHEFRTPLNMIIGLVGLMVETPEIYDVSLSAAMEEDLKVVHRNSEHLAHMINDVLDLTRVEAGQMTLHRQWVDLGRVIGDAVDAIRPLLDKKNLALKMSVAPDLPHAYCDATRVQQVLLNLLSNAARFTDEGWIALSAAAEEGQITVRVSDSGPGIPAGDVSRVFEPFYQGKKPSFRHVGGSGLGLSVSEQLVKLHGGRMWVASEVGAGSSFNLALPISPPAPISGRPGHQIREDWVWLERQSGPSHHSTRPVPFVVVSDDTGEFAPTLGRHLDEIELVPVAGLPEIGRAFQELSPSCVILNRQDPANLWPAIKEASREVSDVPIIGCSVPKASRRAEDLGARGYLTKPVTQQALDGAVHSVGRPVRRVLVVDDDAEARQLFARMLRVADGTLQVTTASSGEEALGRLRNDPPDLALVDVAMPGMDGYEVLGALMEEPGPANTPIILVSALDPAYQPLSSTIFSATTDKGLSLRQMVRCLREVSSILGKPDAAPGPASG